MANFWTIGTFRGIVTGVLLVSFLALIAWAWSKSRRADFEAAARLPLEDEPDGGRERRP